MMCVPVEPRSCAGRLGAFGAVCTRGAGPGSAPECSHSSSTAGPGAQREQGENRAVPAALRNCTDRGQSQTGTQDGREENGRAWGGSWQMCEVREHSWIPTALPAAEKGDGEGEIPGWAGTNPKNHRPAKGTSRRTHREVPQLKQLAKGTGGSTAECRNLWECWRKQPCRNSGGKAPVRVRAVLKRTCTKGWGMNQL